MMMAAPEVSELRDGFPRPASQFQNLRTRPAVRIVHNRSTRAKRITDHSRGEKPAGRAVGMGRTIGCESRVSIFAR